MIKYFIDGLPRDILNFIYVLIVPWSLIHWISPITTIKVLSSKLIEFSQNNPLYLLLFFVVLFISSFFYYKSINSSIVSWASQNNYDVVSIRLCGLFEQPFNFSNILFPHYKVVLKGSKEDCGNNKTAMFKFGYYSSGISSVRYIGSAR